MLGTVDSIDYDGDRLRKVVLRFPSLRDGDSDIVKEVQSCERIGQGSFGTVYRAVCDDYPRLALKISTGKSTRLRQELEVLSRVCTKGRLLLPRFEFGALNKTADLIVIGMELCVPSTLHDLLLSTRITSEAEMLFMAYQVVQAVSYVHMEGCIHRDIKLQNFVFDLDGNVKLIDFGLACTSLKPPPGDVVAGTVSFMSPEMAHNALYKDKRVSVGVAADVWSLGIVLFSIFTQRNPYPSTETPAQTPASASDCAKGGSGAAASATGGACQGDTTNDVAGEREDGASQRQRMNERLLRRVAAGDWQWPVGITVSQDLRQLVNSILVTNPDERPTVETILANKLWNLRRRYPPAAVVAFLGVQDDFLLSHDEAHLLRAVEERSAGVAASLLNSRLHSPGSDATEEKDDAQAQQSSYNGSVRSGGLFMSGTTVSPARSSLKVVQRCGEGGVDGAVAVQVYDVRASTRKRSKPIREISIVMAEETAKTQRSKSARRAKSAVPPSVLSGTSQEASVKGKGPRAASTGMALQPRVAFESADNIDDDSDEEGAVESRGSNTSKYHNRSVSPVRLQDALDTVFSAEAAQLNDMNCHREVIEPSCTTPPLLGRDEQKLLIEPVPCSSSPVGSSEEMPTGCQRGSSLELLEDVGAPVPRNAKSASFGRAVSRSKKKRDAFLSQSSSVIPKGCSRDVSVDALHKMPVEASVNVAVLPPTSLTASQHSAVHTSQPSTPQTPIRRVVSATAFPTSSSSGPTGLKGSSRVTKRAQRMAFELSLDVIWHDEADHRRTLSAMLLVEHAWLLASFRLTIEEDQERYSITWLSEEQEKSAAHPHRFKEVMQVMNKRYQYGFVCDICDYEFLPAGPDEKDLHFFHCPCGRDLCPDCYTAYQRQCTCSCCRVVHPNSCVLREHLLQTGGTPFYTGLGQRGVVVHAGNVRGSLQMAASVGEENLRGVGTSAASAQPRGRGRPPKQGGIPSPVKQKGIRAAKESKRRRSGAQNAVDVCEGEEDELARIHLPRMSIAAMHQQEERVRRPAPTAAAPPMQRPEDMTLMQRPVESVPEGPWRPFARFKKDREEEAARQPTQEERDALLNGDWIRHFYLFPQTEPAHADAPGMVSDKEEPYAFVYHAQPGRTGAVFLTSDFPMHSAVFSMLERQFFVVNQVDMLEGADATCAMSLLKAKGHPELRFAFHALQDIVAYDTNIMKQQRTPGTVSVYQAPRSAYSCNGEPFLYVRWFRFNADRSLSAFLLSNGAVQVYVKNEYELRWFDETRKFLIRYNGVCELVNEETFALAPAINHLLYDSFDG